ncbi:hypothetical protein HW132_35320 [Brasilonema sp. CT11]|nr:hypothetical protein [Brasilonema sp. CT11]
MLNFIKINLTGLVDINIKIFAERGVNETLDTFLQLKTIKRLKLGYTHSSNVKKGEFDQLIYKSTLVPRCSDLVLLNLEDSAIELSDEGLANIVKVIINIVLIAIYESLILWYYKGVPNLEELYLGQTYEKLSLAVIYPLHKLQRITAVAITKVGELIKNMPHLKYVIQSPSTPVRGGFSLGADVSECDFKKIGSTIVVGPNFLNTNDMNIVRQLKDLVTRDHSNFLSKLVERIVLNQEYFTFLVKELNLDINYT